MLAECCPLYPYYDTWQYFISFVHYLDPNRISNLEGMRRLGDWPRWENGSRRMLNFFETGEALITDDRRQEAYEYFKANVAGFKI